MNLFQVVGISSNPQGLELSSVNYQRLKDFLLHQMRMAHIHQQVMIKCLLQQDGAPEDLTIAGQLLQYDTSQLDHDEHVTNNMAGKVLCSQEVISPIRL